MRIRSFVPASPLPAAWCAVNKHNRGDADLEVEEWLWTLEEQAKGSGGAVYHLLGNHEVHTRFFALPQKNYIHTLHPDLHEPCLCFPARRSRGGCLKLFAHFLTFS